MEAIAAFVLIAIWPILLLLGTIQERRARRYVERWNVEAEERGDPRRMQLY